MYEILTFDYKKGDFQTWELPYEYHCVYILENGKQAYVGETTDLIVRVKKHKKDESKKQYDFKRIHVILGPKSDTTSARHYEHLLIVLMSGDGKFQLINGNNGQQKNIYARKNEYELYFDKVWHLLEQKKLVNKKDFISILNSNTYKYSPYTLLTEEQQNALTAIINAIDAGDTLPFDKKHFSRPILVNGQAGTGKTVVVTSLFYHLKMNPKYQDKKIALVIPVSPMRNTLQKVFKTIPDLKPTDIISPIKLENEEYDIIICDETHKLRRDKNLYYYKKKFNKINKKLGFDSTADELDWILKKSKYQVLFYDKEQCVSPCSIQNDYFEARLTDPKRGFRPIELKNQMRIKAGNDYVSYIYDILNQRTTSKKEFPTYEFKIFTSFSKMRTIIQEKDKKYGLSRLCTGYAFDWKSKKNKKLSDICIEGENINWNKQTLNWLTSSKKKEEMGSIYTLHGENLNYVGVVIGNDLYYDPETNKIEINPNCFYDNIVKRGTSYEDLKQYIIRTYAVLLTRGIEGTYLYICDKNLREYLKNYINYE